MVAVWGLFIILPPKEIAITSCPVFDGTFVTSLRLRMGNNISNTFTGKINPRQFEGIYDEEGELKRSLRVNFK